MAERQLDILNPNPSLVTNMAIDRAVDNSSKILNARMDGMEKSIDVFRADLTRVPTSLDRAITGLRELMEANLDGLKVRIEQLNSLTFDRFSGIAIQFGERDARTNQHTDDNKVAVDAAFAASKETINKIEAAFTKLIDGQQQLMYTNAKASDEKIGDIKDRLTALDARTAGINSANVENRTVHTDNSTRLFSIIAIIMATLVGVGEIVAINSSDHGQSVVLIESLQKKMSALELEQNNIVRNTARVPVEKTDLDILTGRLNELSSRLDKR